jgi:predicted carbohydrate-binding protein with CBM5 and CBM33 domain
MTVNRSLAAAGALAVVAAFSLLPAGQAGAHGATSDPPSRAVACAPDGRAVRSAACRAAIDANGGSFADWDNVRVPGVAGRDRERIPDGRLCSGGLADFRGLDLARADWPATRVTAGARFTFRYRQRIPHRGTFRLYVTRDGYDPGRALRWADVPAEPFLTAKDPPIRGDAYTFSGRLPRREGRHVLLAIWRNSDTPDTYYSCSDVRFDRPARDAARPAASPSAAATSPAAANPPADAPVDPPAAPDPVAVAAFGEAPRSRAAPLALAGGGAAAALVAGALLWRHRRRRW